MWCAHSIVSKRHKNKAIKTFWICVTQFSTQYLSQYIKPNQDSCAFVREVFFTIKWIIVSIVTWSILAIVMISLVSTKRIRNKHTICFLPCEQIMSTRLFKLHEVPGLAVWSQSRHNTVCLNLNLQMFFLAEFIPPSDWHIPMQGISKKYHCW